ncbi:MAG: hypothetical protein ACTJFN_02060 [Sphingobacterium sp.]
MKRINYGASRGHWLASPKSNGINEGHWGASVYAGIFWNAPKLMPEIGAGIKIFGQKAYD